MEFQRIIRRAIQKLPVIDSEGHERDVTVATVSLDTVEVRQREPLKMESRGHLWVTGWR